MTLTVSFQNVRTLNLEKINRLYKYLSKSDVIFLSEVDNKDQNFFHSNLFQFHYDPNSFRRIAVMAANNVVITPYAPGLKLTQLKNQNDQTAVYSYLYKLDVPSKRDSKTFFVENFYCIPNLSNRNTDRLVEYLNSQSRKYSGRYICGGDFNLNWLDKHTRETFSNCPGLIQHIHTPTRIAKSTKKDKMGKSIASVSKTVIDLIFTSTELKKTVSDQFLKVIPKNRRDKSAAFDHKSVNIALDIPNSHYYREIKYSSNPKNRRLPKNEDLPKLLSEIDNIDTDQIESN